MPNYHISLDNIRAFDLTHFDISNDGIHIVIGGKNGIYYKYINLI